MKIAIGSDHTGVSHRKNLRQFLESNGFECVELGPAEPEPVDYPDVAFELAETVASGACERGILVCGTGIGVGIAANKVPGILAAVCHDENTVEMSRRHNHANVLCLGAREKTGQEVIQLSDLWLNTPAEGGRHERRVRRILELERTVAARQRSRA